MQLWTVWIAQRTISCHSPLSEGYSMRKCICLSRCFLRLSIDVERQHWLHNVGVTEQRNRWQQTRPSALLSSAALQMKIRRPTVDWLNGSDNGKRMYAGQTPAQSKVYIYIYIYIYIYTHTHIHIVFKTFFYVVRHLDSTDSYIPTGLHTGFFRSWPSLFVPSSFSSVFLVLSFVLASTSVLFWAVPSAILWTPDSSYIFQ